MTFHEGRSPLCITQEEALGVILSLYPDGE
jgi:hypothetical protein